MDRLVIELGVADGTLFMKNFYAQDPAYRDSGLLKVYPSTPAPAKIVTPEKYGINLAGTQPLNCISVKDHGTVAPMDFKLTTSRPHLTVPEGQWILKYWPLSPITGKEAGVPQLSQLEANSRLNAQDVV
jgi:hypothetical protein